MCGGGCPEMSIHGESDCVSSEAVVGSVVSGSLFGVCVVSTACLGLVPPVSTPGSPKGGHALASADLGTDKCVSCERSGEVDFVVPTGTLTVYAVCVASCRRLGVVPCAIAGWWRPRGGLISEYACVVGCVVSDCGVCSLIICVVDSVVTSPILGLIGAFKGARHCYVEPSV